MRRSIITSLANNADAAALATALAALKSSSGQAVLSGGQVSFTVQAAQNEQFVSGDMVGYAYMPTTINAYGTATAQAWHRWQGGDFSIIQGSPMMTVGPKDVPPGAARVIALPLALVDSAGTANFNCGINFYAPATIG